MNYTNILFDLDGTLLNTKPGVIGCVKKAFEDLALTLPPEDELDAFLGPPLVDCFTQVCGLPYGQAETAAKLYRRYYENGGMFNARPYDGIPELLKTLKGKGFRLGVATSKCRRLACEILKHFELLDFFDTVAGAPDDFRVEWAKKDSILSAMKALPGADKSNTVIIGDRKFDAEGAKTAGIDSIGVLFGFGKEDEIKACGFTKIAADVEQLKKLLLS